MQSCVLEIFGLHCAFTCQRAAIFNRHSSYSCAVFAGHAPTILIEIRLVDTCQHIKTDYLQTTFNIQKTKIRLVLCATAASSLSLKVHPYDLHVLTEKKQNRPRPKLVPAWDRFRRVNLDNVYRASIFRNLTKYADRTSA